MAAKRNIGIKGVQFMLFIINLLFVMIGTLLISASSTILIGYKEFETFIGDHYFKPAEILIAVGIVIILVSIFGGIAAIKQSTLLVNIYACLLLILLLMEVSAAIVAFTMRDTVYRNIENNMIKTLTGYNKHHNFKQSWDDIQQRFDCCGVYYPNNWASVNVNGPEINETLFRYNVPYSCCKEWPCDVMNREGCFNVLSNYVAYLMFMVVYIVISVEIAQILGLIFACMLAKTIRSVKTAEEMNKQQIRQVLFDHLNNEYKEKNRFTAADAQ